MTDDLRRSGSTPEDSTSGADLIARAKAALEGVTEGPWRASLLDGIDYEDGSSCIRGGVYPDERGSTPVFLTSGGIDRRDARFIAASRTLVPELVAEVERLRGALDRPAIDANHIDRQRAFSEATFGPGSRLHGVTDHIAKELVEVREAAPNNLDEWVDVIILAFDGAWRTGANSQAIIDAIKAKQTRNEQRSWPDWRTAKPGEAIEHIRSPHEGVLRGDQ